MLSMFQANAHNRLASVKPAADTANSQRVEKTRVSQPDRERFAASRLRGARIVFRPDHLQRGKEVDAAMTGPSHAAVRQVGGIVAEGDGR